MSNREFKKILQKTINTTKKDQAMRFVEVLWAYRIAYKTPIGTSSYKMVYRKTYHLFIELEHQAYWAIKKLNLNLELTRQKRLELLNKLDGF